MKVLNAICGLLIAGVMVSAATSGSPTVTQFQPAGMQRGTQATFTLGGDGLSDVTGITSDDPGIECVEIKSENGKAATLTLKVKEDLPPGLYPIWIVTKTGISNLRLLSIGALPTVAEVEPNSEFDTAQSIDRNTTINGVIDREDLDHFKIDLKANETIHVEIEGLRLHYTLNNQNIFDPYIAILDEGRFEVASSDDASLWQQDGFCSYTADQDASYTIVVRDSSFGGSPLANYRLHVGQFPRPLALLPGGGRPGTTMQGTWIKSDGSTTPVSVAMPSEPSDRFPVRDHNELGISPSPNYVRVVDLDVVPETEPNDSFQNATNIEIPTAISGLIHSDVTPDDPADSGASGGQIEAVAVEDIDYFQFSCKKGTKYMVQVYARDTLRSRLDATINVYDAQRKRIGGSDDNAGKPDPYYEFTAASDDTHFLRITDHLKLGSPLHHYRIEITTASASVTLSPKELRRSEAYHPVVPIGGHGVMVVSAKRQDYGGEITFDADSLPSGVATTTYPIPNGRAEIPIVFTAADDATLGSAPLRLVSSDDGHQTKFVQDYKMVLGQNRRSLWSMDLDHTQLVVAEANPFTVEVVPPSTPIVRQGSKDLVVRITRDEGFKGNVSLRTAYNPPGIGINNSKRFEKDVAELSIPLTANGSAAEGEWPLVFVMRYGTGTGAHEVATAPVMLNVEKEYFKFEFPSATAELGTDSQIIVSTEVLRDLPADAEVEIAGLPKGITSSAPVQPINKETESITFPITIADDAKAGMHKTIVAIGRIKVGDEPIVQTVGTGSIRVDEPLPPKQDVQPAEPLAETTAKQSDEPAKQPDPATAKPLSRLEQLRQQAKGN